MQGIQKIRDAAALDGSFTEEQRVDMVSKAMRLAELIEALDQWITGGGFLPERWRLGVRRHHWTDSFRPKGE
jgi:hypothetical protein